MAQTFCLVRKMKTYNAWWLLHRFKGHKSLVFQFSMYWGTIPLSYSFKQSKPNWGTIPLSYSFKQSKPKRFRIVCHPQMFYRLINKGSVRLFEHENENQVFLIELQHNTTYFNFIFQISQSKAFIKLTFSKVQYVLELVRTNKDHKYALYSEPQ